jgi:hypothetical protein
MVVRRSQNDYSFFTVTTTSGAERNDILASGIKFGLSVNNPGTIEISIPITAEELDASNIREITTPSLKALCFAYRGVPIEGGTIVSRGMDYDSNIYKVTASGIWQHLMGVRMFSPDFDPSVFGALPMEDVYTIKDKTLGSLADTIVLNAINCPRVGAFLPIEVSNPDEVGTHGRTWYGFDKNTVGEQLKALTEVSGGPDIRFRLAWVNEQEQAVKWVMDRGTQANPLLMNNGDDWVIDASVAKSTVVSLGLTEDGTTIGTTAWAEGNGTGLSKNIAVATNDALLDKGYPLRDIHSDASSIEDRGVLAAYALQKLNDGSSSIQQWSVTVSVSGSNGTPSLTDATPGQFAVIYIPKDHPSIKGGKYRTRIMALDGDGSDKMKLTLAPMLGDDGIFDPIKAPRKYIPGKIIPDKPKDSTSLSSSIPLDGGGSMSFDKNGLNVKDKFGMSLGGVNKFGSGFGNIGGGGSGGGGVRSALVVSYDAQTRKAIVDVEAGGRITVTNGEPTFLRENDLVYIVPRASSEGEGPDVILGAPKLATQSSDIFGPYGTSTGFPVDASVLERSLPYGPTIIDVDNVFGFGDGAVIIDSPEANNVWVPNTGMRHTMLPPDGMKWITKMIRISHGKAYIFANSSGSQNDAVYLFQWAPSTRNWILCQGLPDWITGNAHDDALQGMWNADSVGSEIFSDPVVVMMKIRQQDFVGNELVGWAVPITVTIWRWDGLSATWETRSFDLTTANGMQGPKPTFNTTQSTFAFHWALGAGDHVFFRTSMSSVGINNTYGVGDQLFHVDLSTANQPTLVGGGSAEYLGGSYGSVGIYVGATFGASTIRLSPDGLMYCGTPASADQSGNNRVDATIKQRMLGSSAITTSIVHPANMDNNTPVSVFHPQRVWNSDRFIIASRIYSVDNDNKYGMRGALWDHHSGQGTSTFIVPPDAGITGPAHASVSVPIQCVDGSVVANLDTSNQSLTGMQSPSHKIYQVIT